MASSSSDSPPSSLKSGRADQTSAPAAGRRSTAGKRTRALPDYSLESALLDKGAKWIAGVDEVGRGPLAGPVVAAAVVFIDIGQIPVGIDDSKKLGAPAKARLYAEILAFAHVAVAAVSAAEIDRINIRQATLKAMRVALTRLPIAPSHILVDGTDVPPAYADIASSVIKGDTISQSIAAASIIAKVTRDRMMANADRLYGGYGFATNVGYGSAKHLSAIARQGPCPIHRMSFRPLKP